MAFPPFRGSKGHSAPSPSCPLPRPGRRTVYSCDPRTQPKPVESHGLDVTAQVPVVQPTVTVAEDLDETDRGAGGFGSTGR